MPIFRALESDLKRLQNFIYIQQAMGQKEDMDFLRGEKKKLEQDCRYKQEIEEMKIVNANKSLKKKNEKIF